LAKYIFALVGVPDFCKSTMSAENSACATAKLAASITAKKHEARLIDGNIRHLLVVVLPSLSKWVLSLARETVEA
jgi:hypothetical protein